MRKNLKKCFTILTAMVLSVSFAACSAKEGKETAKDNEEVVTIVFWDENAGPNRTPYYEEMIKNFEAEHKNIKVKYEGLPASEAKSKYNVAIQSKTTPDVGGISDNWIPDFAALDAIVPLDDYFDSWDKKDDYNPNLLATERGLTKTGKLYGMPTTTNYPVLWYNTNKIKKAPESWDEVFDIINNKDTATGDYGFSIRGGAGGAAQLEQMLYSYSGITEMFDKDGNSTINDPLHVEFVQKLVDIYKTKTPESDITNGYKEMVAAFDTGVADMIYHNLGSYGEHNKTLGEGNFAVAAGIKSKKGNVTFATNGFVSYALFKTSKHPKEAFEFISYLCENQQTVYFNSKIGQIPVTLSSVDSDYVKNAAHIKAVSEVVADKNTECVSVPINVLGYSDLLANEINPKFQEALMKKISVEEFLDFWAKRMTELKAETDKFNK